VRHVDLIESARPAKTLRTSKATPKTISRLRTPPPLAPVTVIPKGMGKANALARRSQQAVKLEASGGQANRMLTASAAPVSIDFNSSRHYLLRRHEQQRESLFFASHVGELGYAEDYIARAVSGVEVYPATIPRPGQEPERIEDMNTMEWAALTDLANGFQGALTNSIKSMLYTSAWQLGVPGEFWPHATWNAELNRNEYEALPVTMLEQGGSSGFRVRRLPGLIPDAIPKSDRLWRVWNWNPSMQSMAWSPVMWALDILESIWRLTDAGIAASKSRLASAGLLLIPEGMSFSESVGPDGQETGFDEELLEVVSTNMKDMRSAMRWVPVMMQGDGQQLDQVRFISLYQPEMEHDFQRLEQDMKRLDHAINLPSGFLLGFGDMTHWNAFMVDAAIWPHLKPVVEDVLSGWDIVWRDLMVASGMPAEIAAQRCLWFDASKVIAKSDRTEAASEGINLGILRPEVWARVKGFDPEDCYSVFEGLPDAQVRNMMIGIGSKDAGLAITGDLTQMTGRVTTAEEMLPGDVRALKSAKPTSGPKEDLPAGGPAPDAPAPPPAPSGQTRTPPAQPPAVGPAPGVSASGGLSQRGAKLARLGSRLQAIDHTLMVRLSTMADADLADMTRRLGGKLRTTLRNKSMASMRIGGVSMADVSNHDLASHLGPERVATFGVHPGDIVSETAAAYAAKASALLAKAQMQTLAAVADATEQDPGDLDAATASSRPGWLHAAEGALATGMATVGMAYIFHPSAADLAAAKGEVSDLAAPVSAIREAMAFAGGGDPAGPQGSALLVATGPMMSEAAARGGAVAGDTYIWTWGGSDRPFPPHQDIDGVQFTGWDDPAIANDDGWPDSQCRPGDHDGCSCSVTPVLSDGLTPLSTPSQED
jgi:hypothetical protein